MLQLSDAQGRRLRSRAQRLTGGAMQAWRGAGRARRVWPAGAGHGRGGAGGSRPLGGFDAGGRRARPGRTAIDRAHVGHARHAALAGGGGRGLAPGAARAVDSGGDPPSSSAARPGRRVDRPRRAAAALDARRGRTAHPRRDRRAARPTRPDAAGSGATAPAALRGAGRRRLLRTRAWARADVRAAGGLARTPLGAEARA